MSGDSEDEETMATEDEMDDESGGFGKLKLLLLAAVVTAIGVAVYRKVSGDDGFEIEVEEYETEDPPTTE